MDAIHSFIDFLEETEFGNLPEEAIDRAKRFILDTLGVAIAGTSAPGCKETLQTYGDWGGREEATVWFYGRRLPTYTAGLMNSLLSHARDFDDVFDKSALHALATTFPPALTLGEKKRVSGQDLITAVVCGVDVVVRMGLAIRRPLSWIRTATCGGFGAVAVAGKIFNLSREELLHAFGIMYSKTAGNAQCLLDGGLSKRLQPAFAVSDAIQSVALAMNGINGATEVLEGPYGFFNLYEHGDYDRNKLTKNLGKHYHILDLSFKPYPSCRMTHATIQAVLELREAYGISPDAVAKVRTWVSPMVKEMVGNPFVIRDNPQVDAQFSIPYTVAVALTKGDVFIEDFEEEAIRSPELKALADRVEVEILDTLEAKDMQHATVEISLRDGRRLQARTEALKGSPKMDMDWDACVEKFRKCVAFIESPMDGMKIEQIITDVKSLETLKDVSTLVGHLVIE